MQCVSVAWAPHWWSCFTYVGLSRGFHPDAAEEMWDPDLETLTFVCIFSLSIAVTLWSFVSVWNVAQMSLNVLENLLQLQVIWIPRTPCVLWSQFSLELAMKTYQLFFDSGTQKLVLCEEELTASGEDGVRYNAAVVSTFIEQYAPSLNWMWKLPAKTSHCKNNGRCSTLCSVAPIRLPGKTCLMECLCSWCRSSCEGDCLDQSAGRTVMPTCQANAVRAAPLKLIWVAAHWFVSGRSSDTGLEPEAPVTPAELGSANFLVITSLKISALATYFNHHRLWEFSFVLHCFTPNKKLLIEQWTLFLLEILESEFLAHFQSKWSVTIANLRC